MELTAAILKFVLVDPVRSRGAIFCLLILLSYLLLPARSKHSIVSYLRLRFDYISIGTLLLYVIIAACYLVYPNYLDHVESTVTSLGGILQRSELIYPAGDLYPYHGGLPYGPILAELQWCVRQLGLPLIFVSKLPGVFAFITSIAILLHINKTPIARGYLLCLPPFAIMLFWNRSEPFLLLLVCLALLLAIKDVSAKYLAVLLGIVAGAASSFKFHGALYILAAYVAVCFETGISLSSICLFSFAAASTFILFFAPQQISLLAFLNTLKLVSSHGLSLDFFLGNAAFLAVLTIPVFALCRAAKLEAVRYLPIVLTAAIELVVTVLASKPGSGVHHLMPFIPVNAFIMDRIAREGKVLHDGGVIDMLYASLIIPSIIAALTLLSPMIKGWRDFAGAQVEVAQLGTRYPGSIFGISDINNYPFVFLRVLLTQAQIDYPAFMDLQYAGVTDDPLVARFKDCAIPYVILPRFGTPFAMNNLYTGHPLLSDDVRTAFNNNYIILEGANYYSVYGCRQNVTR